MKDTINEKVWARALKTCRLNSGPLRAALASLLLGLALPLMMGQEGCPPASADIDGDGYPSDIDCDDEDGAVHPDAAEVCDGVDNNCDGTADEGVLSTFYEDADGDGVGEEASTVAACAAPRGYASAAGDCDDADPGTHPGASETCDEADDDCDGASDEGLPLYTYYADDDDDGAGDPALTLVTCAPATPEGYAASGQDCDDTDPSLYPNTPATCVVCQGVAVRWQCNATGATCTPPLVLTSEEVCNAVDDDCDGLTDEGLGFETWHLDGDEDGYGDAGTAQQACDDPSSGAIPWVQNATDCDDQDVGVHPGATEVSCNDQDDDCDGQVDERAGGLAETCNGEDDDCDGKIDEGLALTTWYLDGDDDGYGDPNIPKQACGDPRTEDQAWSQYPTDCHDGDAAVNPAAPEVWCNGVNDDCSASTSDDVDNDRDGCSDCARGAYNPSNDGPDADGDGLCDTGDPCTDVDRDGLCANALPRDCDDSDYNDQMVMVPKGSFVMGSDPTDGGYTTESPEHVVNIKYDYCIGETEVTTDEYVTFLNAGNAPPSGVVWVDLVSSSSGIYLNTDGQYYVKSGWSSHPMAKVTWDGAKAFCDRQGSSTRLPSEAEWEKAARGSCEVLGTSCTVSTGGSDPDGDEPTYPWGFSEPTGCTQANWSGCTSSDTKVPYTLPVGSSPAGASPYGALDMAGNLWEWVADCWHVSYDKAPADGSAWTNNCTDMNPVKRGGSWSNSAPNLRSASRGNDGRTSAQGYLGFRCARSP